MSRTQRLKVLFLKPRVGQYIAIHATLTGEDSFLANFYPSCLVSSNFFQNFFRVFPVLAVTNTGSCVGPQNKIGHPAHRDRPLMQVPVLSACGTFWPWYILVCECFDLPTAGKQTRIYQGQNVQKVWNGRLRSTSTRHTELLWHPSKQNICHCFSGFAFQKCGLRKRDFRQNGFWS